MDFWGIFQEDFSEGIYLEEIFGRNCFGGFFERNSLGGIKELMFLSGFCINAQGRKEGQEFRSLEVRGKLIALKN